MADTQPEDDGRDLSADEILSIDDLRRERVYVSLWKKWVTIRALTLHEQDMIRNVSFSGSTQNPRMRMKEATEGTMSVSIVDVRAHTVALGLIKQDGKHIFTLSQVADLANKSNATIDFLFDRIRKLSAVSDAEVKELEGNSDAVPSGDSSSS